ncbi:bifunctional metallophosphatase/5'-nucleotidase [Alkaliphilus peptidifermentans]|uniref:2',3'-cyclic-nucleotide 2'-phosphodiesterase/5'-or 3'-nucleotidase, 5'-nucleotidase family n=1 Tax=Alkaliphilus peptidifermentans DSM 18978 TaxID=1120976 RepID=A0A1G5KLP2_9FIRM|nr:5'-nucleotidase C-terminal domain-containing protein [Alkaliphilus peptidifermentans]SCZ00970.1 2',3'-cyclic-nucleotide 2'-phosphodiesterase/5'-or 3'-nucleotidase, 5'-nucleotidase family [Alkaliphilus peptidifermentans DSM 18978]
MKNDNEWVLNIYSINDFHGVIEDVIWEPSTEKVYENHGVLLFSKLIECINKSEYPIMLSAGDMFESPSFGMKMPGLLTVELLNLVKCKGMTIGNHEFDWIPYDEDFFTNLKMRLDCTFLSANLIEKKTGRTPSYIEKSTIIKANKSKIGVIGLTTESCKSICLEDEFKNYDISDAIITLEKEIQFLKKCGVNLIVLLAHCDISVSQDGKSLKGELVDIIKNFDSSQLQVAIAAHSHEFISDNINGIQVMQAGSYGNGLGNISVTIKNDKVIDVKAKYMKIENETVDIDMDIKKIIDMHWNKYKRKSKKVGFTEIVLKVDSKSESFWGKYIAKILAASTSASIGMINVGSVRSSIDKGDIFDVDIKMNLPFENTIIKMNLPGRNIINILKKSFEKNHGIMQTYGILKDITFDKGRAIFSNIRDNNGNAIELNRFYSIAVSNFIFESIDFKYEFVEALSIIDTNIVIRNAVLEYIIINKHVE